MSGHHSVNLNHDETVLDDGLADERERDFLLIKGTSGDDTLLTGLTGNWVVYANAGNDVITLRSDGHEIVYAGEGNDSISLRHRTGNDTIYGEDGDDRLTAGQLANGNRVNNVWFDGGGGNDSVYLVGTNATILGGNGEDYLEGYFSAGTTINRIDGGNGDDTIIGSSGGSQTPYATRIDGGMGNDSIRATNGGIENAHTITGGEGNDTISAQGYSFSYGGDGDDWLLAFSSGSGETVAHMFGGNGDDRLINYDGNNKLYGDAGNDSFVVGSGNQFLSGGAGDDLFIFTAGGVTNNRLGNDTIADFDVKSDVSDRLGYVDTISFQGTPGLGFNHLVFTQLEKGTLITFVNTPALAESSIFLVGISAKSLTSDMFIFS